MTPPRWYLRTASAAVATPKRAVLSGSASSARDPVTYGTNSWPTFCSRVIARTVLRIQPARVRGRGSGGGRERRRSDHGQAHGERGGATEGHSRT